MAHNEYMERQKFFTQNGKSLEKPSVQASQGYYDEARRTIGEPIVIKVEPTFVGEPRRR